MWLIHFLNAASCCAAKEGGGWRAGEHRLAVRSSQISQDYSAVVCDQRHRSKVAQGLVLNNSVACLHIVLHALEPRVIPLHVCARFPLLINSPRANRYQSAA